MFEGRDEELANTIGNVLLEIMPVGANKITATSEVLEDWAKTGIEFEDASGVKGHFSFDDLPKAAIREVNRALVELRTVMAQGGGAAWNRSVFTANRDATFNVEFSYEE